MVMASGTRDPRLSQPQVTLGEGVEEGGEGVHLDPLMREEGEDLLRPCECWL